MDFGELNQQLKKLGYEPNWDRTYFDGSTMTTLDERDGQRVTTFASADAMYRSFFADAAMDLPPREGALLQASAIVQAPTRARWRVTLPAHSMMKARANGLLAMFDTTGLVQDPRNGALQITILDAATGAIRASWIPPHAVTWLRFDGENLVVDDQRENASICDPYTGRVLGSTEPGMRNVSSEQPVPLGDMPWGDVTLDGLENGYSSSDGLVLVSTEDDLTAYSA